MKTFNKLIVLFIVSCCVLVGCSIPNYNDYTEKEITIYGTVLDAKSGSPLANVLVFSEGEAGRNLGSTVTGSDGTYYLSGRVSVPTNNWFPVYIDIYADKSGYYDDGAYSLDISQCGSSVKIDFQLRPK